MKKKYISTLAIITFLLITSTYASAGLNLTSNDSSNSEELEISSEPTEPNVEDPQFSDDSISSGNDAELNSELSSDKVPTVKIESIEPNPTYIDIVTVFKGLISHPENNTISYKWDFGDGEVYQGIGYGNQIEFETTHIYTKPGTFIVSLFLLKEDIEIDVFFSGYWARAQSS